MLDSVGSVNDFDYVDQVQFTEGDAIDVYFQLIDSSKDKVLQQFKPAGRRLMPAAGATLQVTLDNLDDDKKLVRSATQPFALDPSIWKLSILATDAVRGTVNLLLQLTESGKITRGRLDAGLAVANQGCL